MSAADALSPSEVLSRLRLFLLVLSVMLFGGTLVELFLIEHWQDAIQLIPFVLCGLGMLAVLAALLRPRRATLLALRVLMVAVALGSLFGIYEHVTDNLALQREINPGQPTSELVLNTLGGANPLLAPGTLAVAAVLALAVTYRHPSLSKAGADAAV
jgi:hypothetical protein